MTNENPDCVEGLPPDEDGNCACGAGCTALGIYEATLPPPSVVKKTEKEKIAMQKEGLKFKVKELKKSCDSFPAQWEGMTICGKHIYIRYRSGWLSLGVSDSKDLAICSIPLTDEDEIADIWAHGQEVGGIYDGRMTTDEMKTHLARGLDFSDCTFIGKIDSEGEE